MFSDIIQPPSLRKDLVDLIETVIIYKLPRLSREEIQAMLEVHDIRETKVYQEALDEGAAQERERILQAIPKLAARGLSALEIADVLKLEPSVVNKALGLKAE